MTDLKISQFADGSTVQTTDEIAVNRGGANYKVFVGSAATSDIGLGIGDVIAFVNDGGGNPGYPNGNGSQITDVSTSADLVTYTPPSGSIITSTNVQDAIEELEVLIENINFLEENVTVSNTGSNYDIDFQSGPIFRLTLTDNCTFTISNPPTEGGSFNIYLQQDGTGGKTVTWPGSVEWPGGVAPDLTGSANSVDVFTFFTANGGTIWNGFLSGGDLS